MEAIRKFEQGLLAFVADKYPDVPEGIRNTGVLSDATESALRKAIEEFKGQFTS